MIAVVPSGWRMDFAVFSPSVEEALLRFVSLYGVPSSLAVFEFSDPIKFNSYIFKKTLTKHKILSLLDPETQNTS